MEYCILFFKIYIFLYFIEYSYFYIIYPFKTRNSNILENEKNLTILFRSLLNNHIYINIELGEPRQLIDAFLRTDYTELLLSENKNDINTNSPNPIYEDVESQLNCFYNLNKSISKEFTNISKMSYKAGDHKGRVINDYLHIKNNYDELTKEKISFILYNTTLGNMPGKLGLRKINSQMDKNYNFIEQMKSLDIIDSYFWMINYTSEYEGNFIIGEQPHIFDPIHFKEEDLKVDSPFLYTTMSEWGLRFSEITFLNKNFRPYHESYFYYELNYIKGIDEYEVELDKYFNQSILNGTCFKEYIKYPYGPHKFFYCDKEKYKNNIKYFPPLLFEHKELEYIFELNYKDLFIEKDNKYILLVFFDDFSMRWYLGKPFLKKYHFVINQETKIVGFYKKIHENNIKNNDKKINFFKSNIFKIIGIIIGIIILFLIGIVLGKYYFSDKKKPLNVLDDEYDYSGKNDEGLSINVEENSNTN